MYRWISLLDSWRLLTLGGSAAGSAMAGSGHGPGTVSARCGRQMAGVSVGAAVAGGRHLRLAGAGHRLPGAGHRALVRAAGQTVGPAPVETARHPQHPRGEHRGWLTPGPGRT